jgi:hypothetical protein
MGGDVVMGAQTKTNHWEKQAMYVRIARPAIVALAFASLLGAGSTAVAAQFKFRATLTCGGEVPPLSCKGTGTVNATLDTSSNQLTWTGSYRGLTGKVIGAHFHGPVSYVGNTSEQNAPIQVGTPGNLGSPFKGSTNITATQATDLRDGRWYFNIHTPTHQDGEIRGQLVRGN